MVLRYGEPFSLRKIPGKKRSGQNPKIFRHLAFLLIFVVSFFFANLYATQEFVVPKESLYRPLTFARPAVRLLEPAPIDAEPQGPVVCIIMDDVGRDKELLTSIANIPFPMTLSVLPDCEYTKESADWAHNHGYEVMVHLPMQPEPFRDEDPGQHALLVSMNRREILEETRRALSEIPFAVGVNNHMGSLFTTKRAKLNAVLDVLVQDNLYFVDSRTTARSIGYELAHEKGIPSSERTLFLDDIHDPEPIRERFEELISLARQEGQAVGICHFRPETIAVLRTLDLNTYRDIRFTFPSRIVR
jgi:hypothetical protein